MRNGFLRRGIVSVLIALVLALTMLVSLVPAMANRSLAAKAGDTFAGNTGLKGNINTKDLTRLKKYLSDPDNTEAVLAALDVNCDGNVNTKDLTRMKKHLSDPDNVTLG